MLHVKYNDLGLLRFKSAYRVFNGKHRSLLLARGSQEEILENI